MPADQRTEITTFSQNDDEWWSPQWIIEAARDVLETIDLDPASTPLANERVKATKIFTREDNGLQQDWEGRVFLNPPSKRSDPTARPHLWATKLIQEYEAGRVSKAILVVKSVLGYNWYEDLYHRFWVCHLRERPEFIRPDGSIVGQAKKGVSVFYIGPNDLLLDIFVLTFLHKGRIIEPDLEFLWKREMKPWI